MSFLLFFKNWHSVNLPTPCLDTHVSMKKKIKKFCREESWGEGEGMQQPLPPPPPQHGLRGKWRQQN